jgi:hypothetical protein
MSADSFHVVQSALGEAIRRVEQESEPLARQHLAASLLVLLDNAAARLSHSNRMMS